MTAETPPESREEFRERLAVLVQYAESAGIDVEGGYPVSTDDAGRYWDVEIVAVRKREASSRGP